MVTEQTAFASAGDVEWRRQGSSNSWSVVQGRFTTNSPNCDIIILHGVLINTMEKQRETKYQNTRIYLLDKRI